MKVTANLNKRRFIKLTAAMSLAVILTFLTGGCKRTAPIADVQKPADWGLVTMYLVDPEWPQVPDAIKLFDSPALDIDKDDNVWRLQRGMPVVTAIYC
jgi:hypothetical protein